MCSLQTNNYLLLTEFFLSSIGQIRIKSNKEGERLNKNSSAENLLDKTNCTETESYCGYLPKISKRKLDNKQTKMLLCCQI